ncbi:multiple C2 and transmembrane domain-containing protein isoform X2 [Cryptotermes secundus]|uniref:multiple C2 and transmembrane domain-containing protein isoform X2 n=1 Tax=Cryptotermes secundus TaxID=105785 RepID=UPI001454C6E6|nr:multiple C2 and transmembrane domain-containing protein isoform X2 [Cryptotermes secundus]
MITAMDTGDPPAERSRLNVGSGDPQQGGLIGRHLSKSASDLSTSQRDDHDKVGERSALAQTSTTQAHSTSNVPQVTHKAHHSFFSTLKIRWAARTGSRSKERRAWRKDNQEAQGQDCVDHQTLQGEPRLRRDSTTDYAADNSSEHSSTATPLTQSPRHRVLNVQHDCSPVRRPPSAAEMASGDSPKLQIRTMVSGDPASRTAAATHFTTTTTTAPQELAMPAVVDEMTRKRESSLRQHSFFELRVHLRRGVNLVARDKGGTSDPYVKFKVGGQLLYKSKTIYRDLNPIWDESFTLPIEDPFMPVHIKVFDYDWVLQDDFMGSAFLDLTKLELGKSSDITLTLCDPAKSEYLGEIHLSATLWPRSQEDKDQYFQRNTKLCDVNRRLKSQIWSSVVTIVLVEGKNLLPMDIDGFSDPYAKFRLGNEKYKSKVVYKSLSPSWLEQFDLHLYDDQSQELEVTIWDKDRSRDDFMGRCIIDLSHLEREKTHRIWQDLEEGAGSIFLLLTISGTTASETISDLTTYEENVREREILEKRYAFLHTLHNLRDVGHLTVKVFRAQGLAAADLGGKSDPFCVLELVNARLQTQTEYKTLTPSWQKIFTFNVKDINSVLEVTVYDEDRDHKVEFLGKVAIPLLRIRNGEKKWYSLKDKKLHGRAKGNCPQILLEMTVLWNPIRASIRTLNPKEEKYMQTEVKFKRQVFVRNVLRLKAIIMFFIDLGKFIQSCFEWESTPRSIVAFVMFIVLCYYFEPYMIPIALLLVFLKYYVVHVLYKDSISNIIHHLIFNLNSKWKVGKVLSLTGGWSVHDEEEEPLGDEDDDEEDKDKEEKKSLKERLQAIQEVTQSVQNSIGYIASLGESIKNTFNFTVPYLSALAILLLLAGAVVLYLVSVRYLIMAWGVNKFARKLVRPHTVPNNEVLDLLSRVPDDEDLLAFRELKPHPTTDVDRKRDQKKKHKMS